MSATTAPHDAGGKRKLALQKGVTGAASFHGPGNCYRTVLERYWDGAGPLAPFALFIGMNPSTAEADIDDPTIRKEMLFTRAIGLRHYVKVNIGDYRATNPKDLSRPGVIASSPENYLKIMSRADRATYVILAYGKLPKPLIGPGLAILRGLEFRGRPLHCYGQNGDGSPKHPLYLTNNTELRRFDASLILGAPN